MSGADGRAMTYDELLTETIRLTADLAAAREALGEARKGRDAWTERCMFAELALADIGGYVPADAHDGTCLGCTRWRSTCDAFKGGQDYGGPLLKRSPCLAGVARAALKGADHATPCKGCGSAMLEGGRCVNDCGGTGTPDVRALCGALCVRSGHAGCEWGCVQAKGHAGGHGCRRHDESATQVSLLCGCWNPGLGRRSTCGLKPPCRCECHRAASPPIRDPWRDDDTHSARLASEARKAVVEHWWTGGRNAYPDVERDQEIRRRVDLAIFRAGARAATEQQAPRCPSCDHVWSDHTPETEHSWGGCQRSRRADGLSQCLCAAKPPAGDPPPREEGR